jgi:hypothetical protein
MRFLNSGGRKGKSSIKGRADGFTQKFGKDYLF